MLEAPHTPRAGDKRPSDVMSPLAQRPPPSMRLRAFEQALRILPIGLQDAYQETIAVTSDGSLTDTGIAMYAAEFMGTVLAMTHGTLSACMEKQEEDSLARAAVQRAASSFARVIDGNAILPPYPFTTLAPQADPTPPPPPPSDAMANMQDAIARLASEVSSLARRMDLGFERPPPAPPPPPTPAPVAPPPSAANAASPQRLGDAGAGRAGARCGGRRRGGLPGGPARARPVSGGRVDAGPRPAGARSPAGNVAPHRPGRRTRPPEDAPGPRRSPQRRDA